MLAVACLLFARATAAPPPPVLGVCITLTANTAVDETLKNETMACIDVALPHKFYDYNLTYGSGDDICIDTPDTVAAYDSLAGLNQYTFNASSPTYLDGGNICEWLTSTGVAFGAFTPSLGDLVVSVFDATRPPLEKLTGEPLGVTVAITAATVVDDTLLENTVACIYYWSLVSGLQFTLSVTNSNEIYVQTPDTYNAYALLEPLSLSFFNASDPGYVSYDSDACRLLVGTGVAFGSLNPSLADMLVVLQHTEVAVQSYPPNPPPCSEPPGVPAYDLVSAIATVIQVGVNDLTKCPQTVLNLLSAAGDSAKAPIYMGTCNKNNPIVIATGGCGTMHRYSLSFAVSDFTTATGYMNGADYFVLKQAMSLRYGFPVGVINIYNADDTPRT